jgi:DeoR/GlpR family transcriptional regulator of sugar metabolism
MSGSNLLPAERQRRILDRLATEGRVMAADLSREFGTSEDTIRRDLRDLAAAGACRRVYGGALQRSPVSGPVARRETEAPERKAALARCAAGLIRHGQVVFLDAGSTNHAVARALPTELGITVVTNAISVAAELALRPDIDVVMIGGRLDRDEGRIGGARAMRDILAVRPDLCFLGTCAIDSASGLSTVDPDLAEAQRSLVDQSGGVVVVATTEKLGTSAPFFVVPCSEVTDLVVEAGAPEAALRPYREIGVRVHVAAPAARP